MIFYFIKVILNFNMEDKRILYVSSEVVPYLAENEVSLMSYDVPKMVNDQGGQIRIFMPRYGNINERRHQLHEVIRLSGMNLVVNDLDMPLIIKVASIPKERIQVYFIDNDEYFKRKATFTDEEGALFPDNDERLVFFNRGVIETVKKLGWSPDIIHCQGWFTGLTPLYVKKAFIEDPLFAEAKVIFTIYDEEYTKVLNKKIIDKAIIDGVTKKDLKHIEEASYVNLMKLAIDHSDGISFGCEKINEELVKYAKKSGKPVLEFKGEAEYADSYNEFYDLVLEDSTVLAD